MEYYVVYEKQYNQFDRMNIFDYTSIKEDVEKFRKEYLAGTIDRDVLIEKLKQTFMYRFMYKCEYEIIISSFPNPRNLEGKKIDVYYQIEKNIPLIADMLINEWKENN